MTNKGRNLYTINSRNVRGRYGKVKGQKMAHVKTVTIKDIAQSMNVSVMTVSKVINGHHDISEKTRAEVWKKIDEMGYVPNIMAANLRRNKGNVVALLLSDISKPYFSSVINGYERVLSAAGCHTMIFSSMERGDREENLLRQIASMNIAGVIIDPAQNSDPEKKALKQLGIPYVFSNRFLDADQDYYVTADNETAGYIATKHLLERKPGRPVFCVNGPDRISPTIMRYAGYCRAIKEACMSVDPSWILNNNFDLPDAYQAGIKIAERAEKMTCSVFCSTDQLAVGVLRALRDSGRSVPGDVGVIGVDDIDMAGYLTPALTTITLPKEMIGEKSAKMLIDLMEGKKVEQPRLLLEPKLTLRETT